MVRRDNAAGFDLARGSVLRHFGAGLVVVAIGGYAVVSGAGYVKQNFLGFLGQADPQYAEHENIAEVMLARKLIPGYFEGELAYFPAWKPIAAQLSEELESTPAPLREWHSFAEGLAGRSAKEKRNEIQSYLSHIRFRADQGKNSWTGPGETAQRGHGDAEDLAGLAYYMALASGQPPQSIAIAQGRDSRGFEHAYVLLEEGGQIWTIHFADPGAPPLSRSGFAPRAYGQNERAFIPTDKPGS